MAAAPRVLIIEDNLDARILYQRALEMEDFEISLASSGKEAFRLLEDGSSLPSVILLDLTMPEMSGEEFMKRLRANSSWDSIKVIIVSGWDNLKTRAQEMKAQGSVRKPVDLDQLLDAINACLPQHHKDHQG